MHFCYLISLLNSLAIITIAVTGIVNTTQIQSLNKRLDFIESGIQTKIELELIKHLQVCVEGDCVNPKYPVKPTTTKKEKV